jgi:hypothetical protein
MQHRRNRRLKNLAATLAAAALAAPATQAAVRTDARHQSLVDRASQIQVDAHHQALLRHGGEVGPVVYVTTRPETSDGGTDWSSAAIGAGAAFGVILLGSTALFVGRKKLVSV